MTIREKRTYRSDGWDTFEEYCQERWGWSRGRAYQLMDAAGLVNEMSTRVDIAPPATEFQARPLVQISDPEERATVWESIVSEHGANAPGRTVREAVRLFRGEPTVGDLGADIPPPPMEPEIVRKHRIYVAA